MDVRANENIGSLSSVAPSGGGAADLTLCSSVTGFFASWTRAVSQVSLQGVGRMNEWYYGVKWLQEGLKKLVS